MPCRLLADCLNEVFEYLERDKTTLLSCLLVNHLWCEVSVRILWKNIWNFKYFVANEHQLKVESAILSTLISCLPNESKELLFKNEIFISTPTSKQPLFNYIAFCKVLSINEIVQIINNVLRSKQHFTSQDLKDKISLAAKEIIEMFMNQTSSLKKLIYDIDNVPYTGFPGTIDRLTDLSELRCNSSFHSEFFYQLSQICHNLQSLNIKFSNNGVSNGLRELISSQNNLKDLYLRAYDEYHDLVDIIPALTKHSNTLTKLVIYANGNLPLSFVSLFLNLQEIDFSLFHRTTYLENFRNLQYVTFPNLQTLNFYLGHPKPEFVKKFLEINGKNLKELYLYSDLSFSIAEFCPNLRKLFVLFSNHGGLVGLKTIFNTCQFLESIKIRCGGRHLSEKEVLETVAMHAPKNFYELRVSNFLPSKLFPKDLESFFISWQNRIPKKSLCLFITLAINEDYEENVKIIEKYKNLGTIRKFGNK